MPASDSSQKSAPPSALSQFQLASACERGDWEAARALMGQGASMAGRDMLGRRPLALWLAGAALRKDSAHCEEAVAASRGPGLGGIFHEALERAQAAPQGREGAVGELIAIALPLWPSLADGGFSHSLWSRMSFGEPAVDALAERLIKGIESPRFEAGLKALGESESLMAGAVVKIAGSWLAGRSGAKPQELPETVSATLARHLPGAMSDVSALMSARLGQEALKALARAPEQSAAALLCARFGSGFPEEPSYGLSAAAIAAAMGKEAFEDETFEECADRLTSSYELRAELKIGEASGVFWAGVAGLAKKELKKPEAGLARLALIRGSSWAARECELVAPMSLEGVERLSAVEAMEAAAGLAGAPDRKEELVALSRRVGIAFAETALRADQEPEGAQGALAKELGASQAAARALAAELWEGEAFEAFEALSWELSSRLGAKWASATTLFPHKARRMSENREKLEPGELMLALLRAYPPKPTPNEEGEASSVWSESDLKWALNECATRAGEELYAIVAPEGGRMSPERWEAFERAAAGPEGDAWRRWDEAAAALVGLAAAKGALPYWAREHFEMDERAEAGKSAAPMPLAFSALARSAVGDAADALIKARAQRGAPSGASAGGWRLALSKLGEPERSALLTEAPRALARWCEGLTSSSGFRPAEIISSLALTLGRDDVERAALGARLVIAAALGGREHVDNLGHSALEELSEALPQAALALMELGDLSEAPTGAEDVVKVRDGVDEEPVWSGRPMSDANWIGAALFRAARLARFSSIWDELPAAGEPGALPASPELWGAAAGAFCAAPQERESAVAAALDRAGKAVRLGARIDGRPPGMANALELAVNQKPNRGSGGSESARSWGSAAAKGLAAMGASPSAPGSALDALARACKLTRAESSTAVARELMPSADCGSGAALALAVAGKDTLSAKVGQEIVTRAFAAPKRSCFKPLLELRGAMAQEAVKTVFANADEGQLLGADWPNGLSLLGELARDGVDVADLATASDRLRSRFPAFEPSVEDREALSERLGALRLGSRLIQQQAPELIKMGASPEARCVARVREKTALAVFGSLDGLGQGALVDEEPGVKAELPVAAARALAALDEMEKSPYEAGSLLATAGALIDAGCAADGEGPGSFSALWGAIEKAEEGLNERGRRDFDRGLGGAAVRAALQGHALRAVARAPGGAKTKGRL